MGINWQGEFDLDDIIQQAKIADEAGVHEITVAEAWGRDALSILTVLARETSNVHLGTSIINIFSRTPAAIAQQALTAASASGWLVRPSERWHGSGIVRAWSSGLCGLHRHHRRPNQTRERYATASRSCTPESAGAES